jgi:integrase
MSQDLRSRFEAAGLIEAQKKLSLNDLFDRYEREEIEGMKPTTARNKKQAARIFLTFAGKELDVCEFPHSKALEFAAYLAGTRSEATKAGYIRDVRRVFNWAKERDLIEVNPFDHVARGSFKNKSRERFVSREEYAAILKELNQEGRALLALYRIGGLRMGEALLVKWNDVDFEKKRLLVHSPKTERIKGRDVRLIPLFPELRIELEKLQDDVDGEPDDFVIQTHRTTVRKLIRAAVIKAGIEPWERLIQNLRSSRAIEIYQDFGVIAESEWIGHSEQTAINHYLHLLESDFDRATRENQESEQNPAEH